MSKGLRDPKIPNRIVNSTPVGSIDTQLTKFFYLRVLIIGVVTDIVIDICIYFVKKKYILVVGNFGDIIEERLFSTGEGSALIVPLISSAAAASGFSSFSLSIESSRENSPSKMFSVICFK